MATGTSSATTKPAVSDFIALVKPSITMLAVFTTAGGLLLAPGVLTWPLTAATLLGTALVVAAANTLNCYIERVSDQFMARTKNRPLPAGRMSPRTALWFGLLLAAVSIPALVLLVNPMTGFLAALALVSYVWIYTPMKQISPKALLVGAVPGAIPPLLGWTAMTGAVEWPGVALFAILFVWQIPHFIAITIYRQQEYDRAGIRTLISQAGWLDARNSVMAWTAILVPVSLCLVPLNVAGLLYGSVALVLGIYFMVKALEGLKTKHPTQWARSLFLYSLVYLSLLFAALGIDASLF